MKNKKIVFAINHPAHYHLFKKTFEILKANGHDTVYVIKDKDILEKLMLSENQNFYRLTKKTTGKSKFSIVIKGFFELIVQDFFLLKYVMRYKPDLMVGTDYCITHIGKLLHIPAIVFNEDDININKIFCTLSYPLSKAIVSPIICNVGKYEAKKIPYDGFQKLAYLHPAVFTPDASIAAKYVNVDEPYFIIRLVSFGAGHDIEMKHGGINVQSLRQLISLLEPFGKVFLTSESEIDEEFLHYKLKIDFKDIHHLLYYCKLFIADSQSMIVEAAMLGTPSVRFNSFVGKISVLEELEQKYALTTGVHSSKPDELYARVSDLVSMNNLKEIYSLRRNEMLKDKINVTPFYVWFIENFPQSMEIMKNNPDYHYQFKEVSAI